MNQQQQIEVYVEHEGTIKVAGSTLPRAAGFCAFSYLQKGISPIEFFYIGGNAGQQAMKAMSVFAHLVEEDTNGQMSVSFKPFRFSTVTEDVVTREKKTKDAVAWRTILLGPDEKTLPVKN